MAHKIMNMSPENRLKVEEGFGKMLAFFTEKNLEPEYSTYIAVRIIALMSIYFEIDQKQTLEIFKELLPIAWKDMEEMNQEIEETDVDDKNE